MNIINRTPHALTLKNTMGEIITIDAPSRVIRVTQTTCYDGVVEGIPVHVSKFGEVVEVDNDGNKEGTNPSPLPEPVEGVWYVVSGLVASALPNRKDLLTPFAIERTNGVPSAWQLGTTHTDWKPNRDWYDDSDQYGGASPAQPVVPQLSIKEYLERAELAHLSPIGKNDPCYMGWGALDLPIAHFSKEELIQVANAWMKQFHETDRHLGMWQSGQYSL